MKKYRWLAVFVILTIGMLVYNVRPAKAVPPQPSGFYGTVKVDGANVDTSTVVSARNQRCPICFQPGDHL